MVGRIESLQSLSTDTGQQHRKILWKRFENRPDNFVDSKFLESLVVNADVEERNYWNVVKGALLVGNHVCFISVLTGTCYELHRDHRVLVDSRTILLGEGIAFISGLLLHAMITRKPNLMHVILRAFVLLALTCALSPIYATLTASISPDTTIAGICGLLLVHLYLYDYSKAENPESLPSLTGSLGLASGMCASVLMATRMKNLMDVVSIIIMSLQLYIASPYIQHDIFCTLPFGRYLWSVFVVTGSVMFLSQVSVVATSWLVASLFLVVVLCPMWLVRIEKFKAHINGPWDEAIPQI